MENEDDTVLIEWNRAPRLIKALSCIVALLMLAMMCVTFADVIGRYLFGTPIPGGFEIIEFIMGPMIFSALPIISYNNSHITVGLFDHMFKGGVRRVQQTVVLVASMATVGFIAHQMFDSAEYLRSKGQVGLQLDIQVAPVVYIMSLLALIACLLLANLTVKYLRTGIETTASASLD